MLAAWLLILSRLSCVLIPVNHTDKRAVLMYLRERIRKLDIRGTDFDLITEDDRDR